MNDPIKNNELTTTFAPENVKKVNADILFKNGGDNLFFHLAFEGCEIVAIHLFDKDVWVYGIYYGNQKVGIFFPTDELNTTQRVKCFTNYFPQDKNNLLEKVEIYKDDITFHHCQNDAYCIIGEHNRKNVIQKTKIK